MDGYLLAMWFILIVLLPFATFMYVKAKREENRVLSRQKDLRKAP